MASSVTFSSSLSLTRLLPSFLSSPTHKIKPSQIPFAQKTDFTFLSRSSSSLPFTPQRERTKLGHDPDDHPLQFDVNYNAKIAVEKDESEEKLLGRFRREVFRAGIIQECKRRKFFENKHEKKKRKNREAAKRNRKRRPPPKSINPDKDTVSKKQEYDLDNDNWDLPEDL